jgi:hypothetical protein
MAAPRRLHLNLNFLSAGSHAAAWLWPGNRPDAFVDPTYLVKTARLAERGTFDAVFLADHPSMPARSDLRPFQALEPSIVLTAIAGATSHIGLIGTISSSYNAPWNIARRFASLDIISGGRAGTVPVQKRGLASGMRATTTNAGQVLSIGLFFSLMLAGLAATLPHSMEAGLLAQHVPPAVAHQVAGTPPACSRPSWATIQWAN